MKKISVLILSVLLVCCSACQKTPEKEIVIGKTDTQWEIESAQSEPTVTTPPFCAPTEAVYEWEQHGVLISIDADVYVPQVDKYPVYAVSNAAYTQEQIDKIVSCFLGDGVLYDANEVAYTADELLEMLLWEQRLLSEVQSGKNTTFGGSIEQVEQNIKNLQNELAHIEDKKPIEVTSSEYIDSKNLNAYFYQNSSRNYFIATCDNTLFVRYYRNPFVDNTALADDEILPIQVSRAAAEKMAYECIASMGYADMQLSSVSRGEALTGEEQLGNSDNKQAYVFFFTRVIDDIPLTYEKRERTASGAGGGDSSNAFSEPWEYEFIKIAVSNDGIDEVYINGNMLLNNKLFDNVSLISFEQIIRRAEECFFQLYHFMEHDADNGADKRVIHIDRVKLGYMQVAAQNSRGQNLIPVWDFFGWEEIQYGDTREPVTINGQNSYLTLNAIDGSILDRTQGY